MIISIFNVENSMEIKIISDEKRSIIFKKSDNDESKLLLGIVRLDRKEIDEVTINEYTFGRKSLEKKNGKLNMSLATYIFAWAYHSDIMHQLANPNHQ